MIDLITTFFKGAQPFWSIMLSLGSMIVCWFIRKDAKAEVKNEILEENVKTVSENAERIVSNKQKQAEIAAAPAPDRDDVHNWLRSIGQRDKD